MILKGKRKNPMQKFKPGIQNRRYCRSSRISTSRSNPDKAPHTYQLNTLTTELTKPRNCQHNRKILKNCQKPHKSKKLVELEPIRSSISKLHKNTNYLTQTEKIDICAMQVTKYSNEFKKFAFKPPKGVLFKEFAIKHS